MTSPQAATGSGAADINSWHLTASRSSHPSAAPTLLGPGDLLREIAAGIGAVTVPHGLDGSRPSRLTREMVLSTPAYDVWVMHWPAGEAAALHTHDAHVAFHVVDGAVTEERPSGDRVLRLELRTGDTSVVAPGVPHRLVSIVDTTTVHVHAKELD
ncbi:MAG: cupin domain-containing protein [Ilumatobacteraceae bacterium]